MAGPTTLYQTGVHGSRPAASAGCVLYSCTTHSLVYKSDGSAWTTWMTIPTGASVATDVIFDAAGDLAVGTGADTAAKLTLGASGKVPTSSGSALAYAYPPGYELDYVTATSPVSVTATTEATANTVLTANSVTFDGNPWWFEFGASDWQPDGTTIGRQIFLLLFDNTASTSASIGRLALAINPGGATDRNPITVKRKLTPSAGARVYSVRAIVNAGTGSVNAGAAGPADYMPMYFRIFKA